MPLSIFLLPFGLFVPGFLIARSLRHTMPWVSAFFLSELVLFHSVFWLGIAHVPVTLWTVLACLGAVSAAAFWLQRKRAPAADPAEASADKDPPNRRLIWGSVLVGAVLVLCVAVSPLSGGDTRFRWDFLAERLFALQRFDFYPPITPVDFRSYFFVDGIPPLASFTHWWLYASAGGHVPVLICLLVAAEFATTLAFTYGAAAALYSRRGGILAAGMLAASPLYLRALIIAEETGLTALAISALIYFIVTANENNRNFAMISAGMAAALCALSREYGWIAVIAGGIALLWKRRPWNDLLLFGGVATALAMPWYARNWILTGNPFYSLRFLHFAVNPIHDGFLQYYRSHLGVGGWTATDLGDLFRLFLYTSTFQLLAGTVGAFLGFRSRGYLTVIALLLIAVWIQAAAFTSGGLIPSTRVLSAAMVVLSIIGAGALVRVTVAPWRSLVVVAIFFCQIWTVLYGALYPYDPITVPVSFWGYNVFSSYPDPVEFQVRFPLRSALPQGTRVLTDSAYLHAALADMGVDVIPVWSPEVRFLFSESFEEASRRLAASGITAVVYYPGTLNAEYLSSESPFYKEMPGRWRLSYQMPGKLVVLRP